MMARWYWWRINAWSELTATIVPVTIFVVDGFLQLIGQRVIWVTVFPEKLYVYVTVTTISWILVTFNTKPTSPEKLDIFYKTVKPRGPGWGPVAARNPAIKKEIDQQTTLVQSLLDYILALVFVYGLLLGVGHCFFLKRAEGLLLTLFVGECLCHLLIWTWPRV